MTKKINWLLLLLMFESYFFLFLLGVYTGISRGAIEMYGMTKFLAFLVVIFLLWFAASSFFLIELKEHFIQNLKNGKI